MMDKETAEGFSIEERDRRSFVRVDNAKANLAPASAASWLRLSGQPLGNGGDGRTEDIVAMATSWTPPDAFDGITVANLLEVQKSVDGLGLRQNAQANDWVGHAIGRVLGIGSDDPAGKKTHQEVYCAAGRCRSCGCRKRAEKTEIEAERILFEIAAMALYDPADLMIDGEPEGDEPAEIILDGRVIYGIRSAADIRRLPEKLRRVIVGWGWDRNGNFTVKLADKSKALDQLCHHLGLHNDKLAVGRLDDLAARLARAKKRAAGGS